MHWLLLCMWDLGVHSDMHAIVGPHAYLTVEDKIEIFFTKSAFLPLDFAKYVRNQRWGLRGVGHLFFSPV